MISIVTTRNKTITMHANYIASSIPAVRAFVLPKANTTPTKSLNRAAIWHGRIKVVVIEDQKSIVSVVVDKSPFPETARSAGLYLGDVIGPTGRLTVIEVRRVHRLMRHFGICKGHFEPGDDVFICKLIHPKRSPIY